MPRAKGPKPEPPEPPKLAPDHQRFVDEYLKDLNQVQAYRRANPGTSYRTAATMAGRLLKRVEIAAEVQAALSDLRERAMEDAAKAIRELGFLAHSRITDVVDLTDPADPKLKRLEDVPPEAWAAVQEIARTRQGVRVKLHPKSQALDKVLARLGLSQEITPLESLLLALPSDLADQVRRALEKALSARSD